MSGETSPLKESTNPSTATLQQTAETVVAHEPLPSPTVWPAAVALGATLLLWGLISSLIITVIGALLTISSLAGWIRELRHEHKS